MTLLLKLVKKTKEQIIKKVEKDTLEELMKENNVTIEEKK